MYTFSDLVGKPANRHWCSIWEADISMTIVRTKLINFWSQTFDGSLLSGWRRKSCKEDQIPPSSMPSKYLQDPESVFLKEKATISFIL